MGTRPGGGAGGAASFCHQTVLSPTAHSSRGKDQKRLAECLLMGMDKLHPALNLFLLLTSPCSHSQKTTANKEAKY